MRLLRNSNIDIPLFTTKLWCRINISRLFYGTFTTFLRRKSSKTYTWAYYFRKLRLFYGVLTETATFLRYVENLKWFTTFLRQILSHNTTFIWCFERLCDFFTAKILEMTLKFSLITTFLRRFCAFATFLWSICEDFTGTNINYEKQSDIFSSENWLKAAGTTKTLKSTMFLWHVLIKAFI